MPLSAKLIAAYRAAHYVVFADNGPVMRIGEPCPEIDDLLQADGAASAAFVTPFNPHGLPRDEGENWDAFGRLCNFVDGTSYEIYLGEGNDPEGEWRPEPSLLVVGISRADAESLGRRFAQNAIVFVEKGRAPELVVLA